jgi:hypothetical protein
MTTDLSPVHPLKVPSSILVTESGITIDVRLVHPLKASFPILVTELGIVIDLSPVHPLKASFSTLVTESGITIDESPVHPEKLPPSTQVMVYESAILLLASLVDIIISLLSCPSNAGGRINDEEDSDIDSTFLFLVCSIVMRQ